MIRKARLGDEQGIADVHLSSWKSTYVGMVPDSFLVSLSLKRGVSHWKEELLKVEDPAYKKGIFVFEDTSGKILGLIAGGATRVPCDDFDGELYAVYLYQDQQGKGLGRKLTQYFVNWLVQMGYRKMHLWVLEENAHSRRFYEKIGGVLLPQTKTEDFGGKQCTEVAYGWQDLTQFLTQ